MSNWVIDDTLDYVYYHNDTYGGVISKSQIADLNFRSKQIFVEVLNKALNDANQSVWYGKVALISDSKRFTFTLFRTDTHFSAKPKEINIPISYLPNIKYVNSLNAELIKLKEEANEKPNAEEVERLKQEVEKLKADAAEF